MELSVSQLLQYTFFIMQTGVSLALSNSTLSVAEGNSGTTLLPLCVQLQDYMTGLDRDVPLFLTTSAGTAGIISRDRNNLWLHGHSWTIGWAYSIM